MALPSVSRQAACVAIAGATLFAVGVAFHLLVPAIAPDIPPQFGDVGLFRPWGGWTSTYMVLHPFGFGVLFAAAYLVLLARGGLMPGWGVGLRFGLGLFLVGALPVFALAFASFRVSPAVMASWIVQGVCQYAAAGAAVGLAARRAHPPAGRPES